MTPTDRQRGVALVAVLWIVASLTILVLSFNASVRSHLDVARVEYGISQSDAIIDAAIRVAVIKLSLPQDQNPWQGDGRPHELDILGRRVRFSLQDTKGLINLNAPSPEVMRGLLGQLVAEPKEARRLADEIIAWRKPGNDNEQAGRSGTNRRESTQQAFIDGVELADVPGVSLALAAQLEGFATVNGRSAQQASAPPQPVPPAARQTELPQPAEVPWTQSPAAGATGPQQNQATGRRPTGQPAPAMARINVITAPREVLLALPGIAPATVNYVIAARARTPVDKAALASTLNAWARYVAVEEPGPVYRLTISVIDPAAIPATAVVTIILTKEAERPYYVLSRTSA